MIETGYRLGDIALALNEYGRALPHGRCTYVGIGGHAGEVVHHLHIFLRLNRVTIQDLEALASSRGCGV